MGPLFTGGALPESCLGRPHGSAVGSAGFVQLAEEGREGAGDFGG